MPPSYPSRGRKSIGRSAAGWFECMKIQEPEAGSAAARGRETAGGKENVARRSWRGLGGRAG
jgi:hypothetical protein